MRYGYLIAILLSAFALNTIAKNNKSKPVSLITSEKKFILKGLPRDYNQPLTMNQNDTVMECIFDGEVAKFSSQSIWKIIANGANSEKRTITLSNENSKDIITVQCSKFSTKDSSKKAALSDSQVIEVLGLGSIAIE